MRALKSFLDNFRCRVLLLLYLGCFIFSAYHASRTNLHPRKPIKKRFNPRSSLSSPFSFFKRIFTTGLNRRFNDVQPHPSTPPLSSAKASHRSVLSIVNSSDLLGPPLPESPTGKPALFQESDISCKNPFLPLRNDIFPCTNCGEIFPKPHLLEQHQAIKHAVSELVGEESGMNIVNIIFRTGWTDRDHIPKVDRILKIHNSQAVITRFEEYRESVKSKAERIGGGSVNRKRDERCIADGNELLRFHCSTFACDLGVDSSSSLCDQQYCSVCGIIRSGFSPKLDGISTLASGYRAHLTVPDDVVEEFRFMKVKKAMLICRVIAGRVGTDAEDADKDGGFDSIIGGGKDGVSVAARVDEEELLVYKSRAVLPCFVIVYSV